MSKSHILIVEDEPDISELIRFHCERDGHDARAVHSGKVALELLRRDPPDLVVLDLMLPDLGGLEICRRMKQWPETRDVPVVMVTAKGEEADVVSGLEMGADDYIVKPYNLGELMARMRAVIRRRDGAAQSVVGTGALQLDLATREVVVQGERSQLSAREFALLHALMERPGAILSRDQLENRIYGWGEEVSSNAVDVLIHGMRRKLGPDAIRNVRGLGWRVAADAQPGAAA